ncbi:MAG: DUF1254 domain-containing protein, partial [Mangrovicoccus sp.]|nr:DUF1254 domain-containing protein [Mangrovicoccus sp.]
RGMRRAALAVATLAALLPGAGMADPVKVDAATFTRAETDRYMTDIVTRNGLGIMVHGREPARVDDQPVIRMNRDTLYSSGVYDLSAGPISVTIPEAGGRYVAVQPVSGDHYTPFVLHDGTSMITEEDIGTRYVALLARVFVDAADPDDLAEAHTIQDGIRIEQTQRGTWSVPDWDAASLDQTRSLLLQLGVMGMDGFGPRMGPRGEVDEVGHLLATAGGWGLNPESEARYFITYPEKNDGSTVYLLTLGDVPVDGFWSVTVYDANGFMVKNDLGRNAVNSVTADLDPQGGVSIQFGGCTEGSPNCLPVTPGWNYTLRLYQPRAEVQDGRWTPPVAEAAD